MDEIERFEHNRDVYYYRQRQGNAGAAAARRIVAGKQLGILAIAGMSELRQEANNYLAITPDIEYEVRLIEAAVTMGCVEVIKNHMRGCY